MSRLGSLLVGAMRQDRGPYVPRCSYPPEQLRLALEANQWLNTNAAQMRKAHNEMVVDLRSVVSALPDAVEGLCVRHPDLNSALAILASCRRPHPHDHRNHSSFALGSVSSVTRVLCARSFYLPASSSREREEVKSYQANFAQTYPHSAPAPLMVLDLEQSEAPFALAPPN